MPFRRLKSASLSNERIKDLLHPPHDHAPFRKILSTTTMLSYTFKVIAAFMVHLLLFCLDGRTIQIEQHLPLHLGEMLCKLFHPGLIIDGETAYNVDMLDSWLFWGLMLLPLCFYFCGGKSPSVISACPFPFWQCLFGRSPYNSARNLSITTEDGGWKWKLKTINNILMFRL